MTAPSGKLLPTGLRYVQVFELDSAGLPAASSTTVYEGISISGPKAFSLNVPDARVITHDGGDGVLDVDSLPPLEPVTGELRVAADDFDLYAILTGTKVVTLGETKIVGGGTSKQGFEPEVGLLMCQQAKDLNGNRNWRSIEMPKSLLHAKDSGMVAEAAEQVFQVMPSRVSKHLWGASFALATDGFSKAFYRRIVTQYFPWLVAWKGDNIVTEFLFHTDRPAVATSKINGVWINGVIDATAVLAVDGVTPTTKPGAGDIVVAYYEIANPEEA